MHKLWHFQGVDCNSKWKTYEADFGEDIYAFFFFSSLNWYRVLCVSLNGFNWQKLPGATERSCWQINHLCDPKKDAMEENKCPSFIWKLAFGTEVTWKWSSGEWSYSCAWVKALRADLGLGLSVAFLESSNPLLHNSGFFHISFMLFHSWFLLTTVLVCGFLEAKGLCSQMLAQMFQTPYRLIWVMASPSLSDELFCSTFFPALPDYQLSEREMLHRVSGLGFSQSPSQRPPVFIALHSLSPF